MVTKGTICPSKLLHWVYHKPMNCIAFNKKTLLAVIGCITLLYLAVGGAFVHNHTGGGATACHVCQSLHVPALAAARLDLIPEAPQVAWHTVIPDSVILAEPFALHRASRAPPSA